MAKRTVVELIGIVAQWWTSLSGPLVPPGKNYAESQAYSGFQSTFDTICGAQYGHFTQSELDDLIANFSFPAL